MTFMLLAPCSLPFALAQSNSKFFRFCPRISNPTGSTESAKAAATVAAFRPANEASTKLIVPRIAEPMTVPAANRHKSGSSRSKR